MQFGVFDDNRTNAIRIGVDFKGTAFGDIKCDKYEFSYSESGSTIKVSAYLDCNKGILMKVDANYDLKELGKVSVNLVLKSSKMVGVTN